MKRSSFCNSWEFARDDEEFAPVVVPHDAMLGNRRGPDAPAGSNSGYYYGATYRYRKQFTLTQEQVEGALLLEFEGVYRDARIAVNGIDVPAPPYGFIPFFADIAPAACEGENIIEVTCENVEQPDCRWYSGAGIFRPVWLWEGPEKRIAPESVRVTTLSVDPALVRVDVDCEGGATRVRILDGEGACVAAVWGDHVELSVPDAHLWSADSPYLYRCVADLYENSQSLGDQCLFMPSSDAEPPAGFGYPLDSAEVSFGIRTLEWGPNGFFVNGRETLLQGGCIHCDNGILGAASHPASEWRRVRLLKEAGFNALRIAHNPAPAALLEACDREGMYVMDEAWDMWFTHKSHGDYARHFLEWCDHDLRRMVARDYNHPSVVMYSIGNEVADPLSEEGVELEQSMVALLHALDPTRPVTCGLNLAMLVMERVGRGWYEKETGVSESAKPGDPPRSSLMFNLAAQAAGRGMTLLANVPGADALVSPALDALDIAGYNYASARYTIDARKHPKRVVVGSETFPYELPANWRKCQRIPNLIGDFMWAAWDYLGEAGAGSWAYSADEAGFSKPWPWLIAGSGTLDILGQPNAAAALAGAVWQSANGPSIQVRPVNRMNGRTYKATWRGTDAVPSWSWMECEGLETLVEVYDGNASGIRLQLNGVDLAGRYVKDCVARFTVMYKPGTLTAVSLDEQGTEIARSSLVSATAPLHIDATPELACVRAGDVAYVAVSIRGANGQVESNADACVTATVEDGVLLGFGSAQPAPTESFLAGSYTTYRGWAQAVVYRSEPGVAMLTVSAPGLGSSTVQVEFAG